jgi:hypothetical protein
LLEFLGHTELGADTLLQTTNQVVSDAATYRKRNLHTRVMIRTRDNRKKSDGKNTLQTIQLVGIK